MIGSARVGFALGGPIARLIGSEWCPRPVRRAVLGWAFRQLALKRPLPGDYLRAVLTAEPIAGGPAHVPTGLVGRDVGGSAALGVAVHAVKAEGQRADRIAGKVRHTERGDRIAGSMIADPADITVHGPIVGEAVK